MYILYSSLLYCHESTAILALLRQSKANVSMVKMTMLTCRYLSDISTASLLLLLKSTELAL